MRGFIVYKRKWFFLVPQPYFDPQTPFIDYFFFGNCIICTKDGSHFNLVLFITKELLSLLIIETPFLKRLVLTQNPQLIFPSKY